LKYLDAQFICETQAEMSPIKLPVNSLRLPLSLSQQADIVDWFSDSGDTSIPHDVSKLSHYFQYLQSQCYQASHLTSIETYQEMMAIAENIKNMEHKDAILQKLTLGLQGKEEEDLETLCESSIDLTVRSLLMLDVGEWKNAYTGRRPLIWKAGTLQDFIQQLFPPILVLDHDGVRLNSSFTARNIKKVAGVKICWTPNLADHLRVTDSGDSHTVSIFHHAAFLQCQLK
jgi:hypothetical protein